MNKASSLLTLVALGFFVGGACSQTSEHPSISGSSIEFEQDYEREKALLAKMNFDSLLTVPSLGAAPGDLKRALDKIRANSIVTTLQGQHGIQYDVILQPGHYGRSTGIVGTQGKYVSEQKLAAFLVGEIAKELRATKLNVLVVSADSYIRPDQSRRDTTGLQAKVFLSIHADGSKVACKTGPSLAYKSSSSTLAMHAIGHALARSLGYAYEDFRKDGFTANSANYYMFGVVRAPLMTGLLEVGELTCERVEERLILSAPAIAANVSRAIRFVLDTK